MFIIHIYFSASCEMLDKADAVLTSVKTKSVDSASRNNSRIVFTQSSTSSKESEDAHDRNPVK